MGARKTDKTKAEANCVREALSLTMKKRSLGQHKIAEIIGRNQSQVSKFLGRKIQLDDEAIEAIYAQGLVVRPTEQDLEKERAQEQIPSDSGQGIEYISINDLCPHPANQQIYGDSADEELVGSIKENGIISPLIVTKQNVIVSGHRRFEAAWRAGLEEVPVIRCEKTDELEVEALLIEANKQRQKTAEQIGREYSRLKEIETEKAKRRMSEGGQGQVNSPDLGQARDIAAEKLGIGAQKAERAASVIREIDKLSGNGEKDKAEELRNTLNTKSVNAAFMKVRPCTHKEGKVNSSDLTEQEGKVNSSDLTEQEGQVNSSDLTEIEKFRAHIDEIGSLRNEVELLKRKNAELWERMMRWIPVFRRDGRKVEGWEIGSCREAKGWPFRRNDGKTGHVPYLAGGEIGFIVPDDLADVFEAELSEESATSAERNAALVDALEMEEAAALVERNDLE